MSSSGFFSDKKKKGEERNEGTELQESKGKAVQDINNKINVLVERSNAVTEEYSKTKAVYEKERAEWTSGSTTGLGEREKKNVEDRKVYAEKSHTHKMNELDKNYGKDMEAINADISKLAKELESLTPKRMNRSNS